MNNIVLIKDLLKTNVIDYEIHSEIIKNLISESLKEDKILVLDFKDIEFITTAFWSKSISSFFEMYNSDYISKNIKFIGLDEYDSELLYNKCIPSFVDFYLKEKSKRFFEASELVRMAGEKLQKVSPDFKTVLDEMSRLLFKEVSFEKIDDKDYEDFKSIIKDSDKDINE